MIKKETYTDEMGRKVKTVHKTQTGSVDYVNEYFYDDDNGKPSTGIQTYYDEKGNITTVRDAVRSKTQDKLVFIREVDYNEKGQIAKTSNFDEETGEVTKEKEFRRVKKDSYEMTFVRRRTFDGKKVTSDDVYLAAGGSLWPIKGDEKILKEIGNPFQKEANVGLLKRFMGRTH